MWYGLRVGLTYEQALDIPYGELLDFMDIERINTERLVRRRTLTDEDIIPDVR